MVLAAKGARLRMRQDVPIRHAQRLPPESPAVTPATPWVRRQLAEEYRLELGEDWTLGGAYAPSPGLTLHRFEDGLRRSGLGQAARGSTLLVGFHVRIGREMKRIG
jgi:hypothetical protein